jgi:hypothetical protein
MKINLPTIFTFNLWGPIGNTLNYKTLFKTQTLASMTKNENNYILPILNYEKSSVEERAVLLENALENLIDKNGIDKFNLVSFALNGLDARLCLNENKQIGNKVSKFFTVATPHKGSVISNALKNNLIPSHLSEKITFVTGTHFSSLIEIDNHFMKDFNNYLEDQQNPNFYSINGDKDFEQMNEVFKKVFSILLDLKMSEDAFFGDGIFFENETKFFNHFGQFNADFYQLSQFAIDPKIIEKIHDYILEY